MCEIFKNTFLKRTPPVALLYGRLLLTGAKAKKNHYKIFNSNTKYLTEEIFLTGFAKISYKRRSLNTMMLCVVLLVDKNNIETNFLNNSKGKFLVFSVYK